MKHLDLFSGIGGFALAASWVWGEEHDIHSFVEIEPFCQKVLKKHWPRVPVHSDIKEYKHDGTKIDLLTGGFPCQPFSSAGNRNSEKDDRFLWPQMLRVIREIQPAWIIGENVDGIRYLGLSKYIIELESAGYRVQAFRIPACAINAMHRRNRIWIIANSINNSDKYISRKTESAAEKKQKCGGGWIGSKITRHPEVRIFRGNDGLPEILDRNKALGNAIVPQVVVPIMQAIKQIEESIIKL